MPAVKQIEVSSDGKWVSELWARVFVWLCNRMPQGCTVIARLHEPRHPTLEDHEGALSAPIPGGYLH